MASSTAVGGQHLSSPGGGFMWPSIYFQWRVEDSQVKLPSGYVLAHGGMQPTERLGRLIKRALWWVHSEMNPFVSLLHVFLCLPKHHQQSQNYLIPFASNERYREIPNIQEGKKNALKSAWVQTLDTQQWDTGGGTTHDIASGQNLFLREEFSITTATITTTEISGSSQEMITLISLEVKIRIQCLDPFLLTAEKRDLYFPIW